MDYPQWVTRAQGIGPVLCNSEEEKAKLLADWKAEQASKEEAHTEDTAEFEEVVLAKPKHDTHKRK